MTRKGPETKNCLMKSYAGVKGQGDPKVRQCTALPCHLLDVPQTLAQAIHINEKTPGNQ